MTYTPPLLPTYLAGAHKLQPVTGVPTDEEIKAIHAVVRAMEVIAQVPELYDPGAAMDLSQHLFKVQMARYRNQYSFALFPGEVIYTPPELPAHIPNALEPIIGFPSDDQLMSVRAALRASDGFSNTSMFDADLSMRLSQHLFNIQLARYIQDTTQTSSETTRARPGTQIQPEPQTRSNQATITKQAHTNPSLDSGVVVAQGHDQRTTMTEPPQAIAPGPAEQPDPATVFEELAVEGDRIKEETTSQLLHDIRGVLENVNRVLIGSQHSFALGTRYNQNGRYAHTVINHKGEIPQAHDVVSPHEIASRTFKALDPKALARSLQFYAIGSELIEERDELKIKSGMEDNARSMLRAHIV